MERKSRKSRTTKDKTSTSSSNYFDQKVEDAIIEFQNCESFLEKQKIFVDRIRPAFVKLIENIIFVYKFHTIGNLESLKQDCISFLFESLCKFDATRGHKAFSYFNIVVKNWFIQRAKFHKKKSHADVHFDDILLAELEKREHEAVVFSFEKDLIEKEFFVALNTEMQSWSNKIEKEQERKVLEAVLVLFSNTDSIPLFNKKSIYTYLREISGLNNTKQLVTNLNKLKRKYFSFKKKWLEEKI